MSQFETITQIGNAELSGKAKIAFATLSTALVVFSLYTAMFGVFPDMIQRGAHISAVIGLVYVRLFGLDSVGGLSWSRIKFFGLGVIGSAVLGYQFFFYEAVVSRFGSITNYEMPIAVLAIILLLDATRRTIGWSMVGLAIFFLIYAFYGRYFPGLLAHRGYDMVRILEQVYLGADGIYGTPLGVSSTFVIIIVVLGALLEKTGASGVLMDIAVSMTRNSRGGPAKAAVVGSSLMGMISGTAVANVLTTGTISIPLMRRGGYRPAVAGAVEAVASTGGQLMPPIMGAAAFLMADIMEVPYLDITKAALLPALLFYIAVFASVHLEAVKTGLKPLESIDIPDVAQSLRNSGHVLLSIPVFIGTLISGYSVMYSSLAGIVCLLALSLLRYSSRLNPRQLIAAAVSAAEAILPVALATATAGIIIGVVTLTGMGLKFSSFIVSISGNNLLVALVLTMASSLVLGMGLPTAAAYILVATLTAPALVSMGVDLMAAHMFVFYSAMLSSITPPVALAAFAAAAICREPPMRVAMISVKFGFVAFLLPYFFVLEPRLLGMGDIGETVGVFAMAVVGVLSLACVLQGYAFGKLTTLSRIVIGIAALAVLMPDLKFKLIGIAAILAVLAAWKIGQFTKSNQN
ncbi:TRAP transporter fused permease subunit [Alphaproteobacteria bacterium]|nr:TRAP transporter fused permease subunit [Alphaproteobacteria bacterium]